MARVRDDKSKHECAKRGFCHRLGIVHQQCLAGGGMRRRLYGETLLRRAILPAEEQGVFGFTQAASRVADSRSRMASPLEMWGHQATYLLCA